MSQPVKLSDQLVLKARQTAEWTERSIAGQIEYWAELGEVLERMLDGERLLALRRAGAAKPLSECLATVGTEEGRKRVGEYLASQPFPHFEPAPGRKGLLVRIEEDGTRTIGKFVNRQFRSVR